MRGGKLFKAQSPQAGRDGIERRRRGDEEQLRARIKCGLGKTPPPAHPGERAGGVG